MSTTKVVKSLLRLKQTFYDQGEKLGKMLALWTKQLWSEWLITSLQNDDSEKIVDRLELKDAFKKVCKIL